MVIPYSSFDTRILPPKVARELWCDLIGVLFDAQPTGASNEDFFVGLDAWLVDGVGFAAMKASPHRFNRSRNKIARDGMDGYLLQFYIDGESQDWNGRYTARKGDLYVLDMARPMSTATNPHSHIDIVVPRRLLAPLLKQPDDSHELVLDANLPLVSLLRSTASCYLQNLSRFSVGEAQASLAPLLGLAAAAINGSIAEDTSSAVDTALLARIRQYIDLRIFDPSLSLEGALGAFGVSRRTLYRLFEPFGGFQSYVRKRRLDLARRALQTGPMQSLSISEIAQMHGFSSPELFARSFRKQFGLTPREMRFHAGEGLPDVENRGQHELWSRWVIDIGR